MRHPVFPAGGIKREVTSIMGQSPAVRQGAADLTSNDCAAVADESSRCRGHGRRMLCAATPVTTSWSWRSGAAPWPDRRRSAFTFNARAALDLGVRLLGLRPGDAVLFPAYCCGAELDSLLHAGLRPVFYRVGPDLVPDLEHLDHLQDPAIKAILVIHYFGRPQPMQPLRELARRRGLLVIEDCAHALFALDEEGRPVGDLADLAVFSLRKHLPVPDGGMMLVADRLAGELAPRPRSIPWRLALKSAIALAALELEHRWPAAIDGLRQRMGVAPRLQPIDASPQDFPQGARFEPDSVDWRMSRLSLAMVARVDGADIRARRRANFRRLAEALRASALVRPIWRETPPGASPWIMPVLPTVPQALCRYMIRHGVEAYRVWPHRHPAVTAAPNIGGIALDAVVALPVQQGLDDSDMDRIAELICQWQADR